MRLVSVNVGGPREVAWNGRNVTTSIWKSPIDGRVRVSELNIVGDRQSDLTVHGGADKAVYAYPSEHYPFWREQFPGMDMPWGAFGENLTTEGLFEDTVQVGDRFRVGTTELVVTQPRMPCFKLGIRFSDASMVKRFLESGRVGFYLKVVRPGDMAAGDPVEMLDRVAGGVSIMEVTRLYSAESGDPRRLRLISEQVDLPGEWRRHFRERLERMAAQA